MDKPLRFMKSRNNLNNGALMQSSPHAAAAAPPNADADSIQGVNGAGPRKRGSVVVATKNRKPPLSRALSCEEKEDEGPFSTPMFNGRKQSLPAASAAASSTHGLENKSVVGAAAASSPGNCHSSSSSSSSKVSLASSSSSSMDESPPSLLGSVLNQGVIRIPRKTNKLSDANSKVDYMKTENSRTSLRMRERKEFQKPGCDSEDEE